MRVTCVSHIAEADAWDTVSVTTTVIGTGLRDVDAIQCKRRGIPIDTALLEPAETRLAENDTEI